MMEVGSEIVRALYSKYPYPSPTIGLSLSYDMAILLGIMFPNDNLSRKKILDAGCGTGHRMLGLAKQYPGAIFYGIDITERSLEVADRLMKRHNIKNVTLNKQDILNMNLDERFDIIVSTGVIHHLEDPQMGLSNLCQHLSGDGVICLWLYHPFGEFDRLIARELLLTLWNNDRSDLSKGQWIMERLQLNLIPHQYGYSATQSENELNQLSINADAFMHPIVNAYRFAEAMALFKKCELDWVAINGINTAGTMKLIDLAQAEECWPQFCLQNHELFNDEALIELYRSLSKIEQLNIIELARKPTGFTVIAGKNGSLEKAGSRIYGNHIHKGAIPAPHTRMLRVY